MLTSHGLLLKLVTIVRVSFDNNTARLTSHGLLLKLVTDAKVNGTDDRDLVDITWTSTEVGNGIFEHFGGYAIALVDITWTSTEVGNKDTRYLSGGTKELISLGLLLKLATYGLMGCRINSDC